MVSSLFHRKLNSCIFFSKMMNVYIFGLLMLLALLPKPGNTASIVQVLSGVC
jgi:hypothetical protein